MQNCVQWCKNNICPQQYDLAHHHIVPNHPRLIRPQFKPPLEAIRESSFQHISQPENQQNQPSPQEPSLSQAQSELKIDNIINQLNEESNSFRGSLLNRMTGRIKQVFSGKSFLKPKNRYEEYDRVEKVEVISRKNSDSRSSIINGYKMLEDIHRGDHCLVRKACKEGQMFAVKTYTKSKLNHLIQKTSNKLWINGLFLAQREAAIGKRLPPSPYLAHVHQVWDHQLSDEMSFVTQLLGPPVLQSEDNLTFTKSSQNLGTIREQMWQVAKGIQLLHQQDIVHKDIKAQNILLKNGKDAVIIDFSRACPFNDEVFDCYGTAFYTPPEILAHSLEIQRKAWDIWSFGCLLYSMHFLKLPFRGDSTEQLLGEMRKELVIKESSSEELKQLLQACLRCCPKERATIEEVVESRYFVHA